MIENQILLGDVKDKISLIEDKSVNLIFTSPPYAEQRKDTYGGIPSDEYVEWFLSFASELKRVLADDGSFFLNIKEHSNEGIKDLYVLELVLALVKETGFVLIDTYSWTKNGYPSKNKNKFKNAWEPVFHFAKQADIKFFPHEVSQPVKESTKKRANRKDCGTSKSGSGFTSTVQGMKKIKKALPSNHLHINSSQNQYSDNIWHSAVFPSKLPNFFIKAFTEENDLVLDPFSGSATTVIEAKKLNRRYIGIEKLEDYYLKSVERLKNY